MCRREVSHEKRHVPSKRLFVGAESIYIFNLNSAMKHAEESWRLSELRCAHNRGRCRRRLGARPEGTIVSEVTLMDVGSCWESGDCRRRVEGSSGDRGSREPDSRVPDRAGNDPGALADRIGGSLCLSPVPED